MGRLDHAHPDADTNPNADAHPEGCHLQRLAARLRRPGQWMVVMVMMMAGQLMVRVMVVMMVVVDGRVRVVVRVVMLLLLLLAVLLLLGRGEGQTRGQLVELGRGRQVVLLLLLGLSRLAGRATVQVLMVLKGGGRLLLGLLRLGLLLLSSLLAIGGRQMVGEGTSSTVAVVVASASVSGPAIGAQRREGAMMVVAVRAPVGRHGCSRCRSRRRGVERIQLRRKVDRNRYGNLCGGKEKT